MIGFLTNIAPIALGFIAKLIALKSQAASDQQKLMIENMQARMTLLIKLEPGQIKKALWLLGIDELLY